MSLTDDFVKGFLVPKQYYYCKVKEEVKMLNHLVESLQKTNKAKKRRRLSC